MPDALESRIIEIVQNTLDGNNAIQNHIVTADDSMETIADWDSLTFMNIFVAINEAFSVNPDFDEAIHYTSIKSLHSYLASLGL